MIRLRTYFRAPHGVRPWAAGLALAAAGPAWAAPSAVETLDAAAIRELGATESMPQIRPASAQVPAAPQALPTPGEATAKPATGTRPKPTTSQLEVMRQLDEMYKRDGRGPVPSMRMKDAPNTRLPSGQLPGPPQSASSGAASGIQQTSSPPSGGTTPKAATRTYAAKKKSRNPIVNFFSGDSSSGSRRTTSAGRPTRRSSTSTVSGGGIFDRMLKPLRGKDEKPAMAAQPPLPPPLPGVDTPARVTRQPAASQAFRSDTEPFVPPSAPAGRYAGPVAPAAPVDIAGSGEENPFADVQSEADAVVIDETPAAPAQAHPLGDAFVDVRGAAAPEESAIANLDPEFATPIRIHDRGAPRPLDPEAVSSGEVIAPVQVAGPPAAPAPQQSAAARMADLQRKLAERSGLGGFQGFCPVTLRDRRELVDSRPEFLSVYQNRTYELSSAEAKARFEADPVRYAPVNGGNDVVLTARGEAEAEGSLTHAVWFKDRLYLFRTAETLREFNAEPAKYAPTE